MQDRQLWATKEAINNLIAKRGERARHLWNLATQYSIFVSPEQGFSNLQNMADVLSREFQSEAKGLIQDIERVLKNPPPLLPTPGIFRGTGELNGSPLERLRAALSTPRL